MGSIKASRGAGRTILLATAVAGTLDITDACVYYGVTKGVAPERIFQSVASGLLGKAAYAGGATTVALGLFLHFAIMAAMAAVYVLASRRLPISATVTGISISSAPATGRKA